MTTKKPHIQIGEQVKKYTRPRDGFWFSDDIRDWIESSRIKSNRKDKRYNSRNQKTEI